ncbi:MAG: sulfite exporter TauE/SafE family protein [Phycisphaerae bacterium]|nr:sulfite exporter TauE/SafE family protein [Phycisphaerae bacterium]
MPHIPDLSPWPLVFVGVIALLGSMFSAVSGFGSAAVLLPVLAFALGEKEAVPVLTIAQIVGNASKGWFNRAEVRWSAVRWYLLSAVPAAVLGSLVFLAAPARLLAGLMGGFLLLAVAWRRWRQPHDAAAPAAVNAPMPDARLSVVGLFTGALSALVGGAGPIAGPFFLATGLVKGAYIGTEALAALGVHTAKLAAYGGLGGAGILSPRVLWLGLALSPLMIGGAYLGKRLVDHLSRHAFVIIVEWSLIIAAGLMLWRALRGGA